MTSGRPARITYRRTRLRRGRVVGLLLVMAVTAVLCDQLLATSTSSTSPPAVRVPAVEERRPRTEHPAVPGAAGLDPALLAALRRAAAAAAAEGVQLRVDSGRRSPEHQQRLLDEAVLKYGSLEEAARWVATPETSAHVAGDAIDIGPAEATAWLSRNGAAYGLCQIYANEPWHYELRSDAPELGCPAMYPDPAHDPRMQQ